VPASATAAKPYEPKTLQSSTRAAAMLRGNGRTAVRPDARSQSETGQKRPFEVPASHATSEPCSASATIVRFVSRIVCGFPEPPQPAHAAATESSASAPRAACTQERRRSARVFSSLLDLAAQSSA
jgi:hypothetical protein